MSDSKVFIVGAGSVGGHIASNKELYGLAESKLFFVDDDKNKLNTKFFGAPVLGNVDSLLSVNERTLVIMGIAFPTIKESIIKRLRSNPNLEFPSLIAKNAWISNKVFIGQGAIVYPGCCVNYGSNISDFVVMNMNCAIGHNCRIGLYTSFSPGVNLGGHTQIGEQCEMGIGSATKQFITIGDRVIVGGNSMIVKNVDSNRTIKGIPAK